MNYSDWLLDYFAFTYESLSYKDKSKYYFNNDLAVQQRHYNKLYERSSVSSYLQEYSDDQVVKLKQQEYRLISDYTTMSRAYAYQNRYNKFKRDWKALIETAPLLKTSENKLEFYKKGIESYPFVFGFWKELAMLLVNQYNDFDKADSLIVAYLNQVSVEKSKLFRRPGMGAIIHSIPNPQKFSGFKYGRIYLLNGKVVEISKVFMDSIKHYNALFETGLFVEEYF
ncbi:MAG TPA: hypothetical protein EYQ50_29555 [Verrucomicrobiales bacterium]|nr:hypothetical protein [Verrucomicrobiales bacterium]